mmetsp:Transcript_30662/g.83992  ORF Transcript_30662/g.83992 Transcript_30662/m.83992 type:complete len:255 (-) Transcript_30662:58-822(-)
MHVRRRSHPQATVRPHAVASGSRSALALFRMHRSPTREALHSKVFISSSTCTNSWSVIEPSLPVSKSSSAAVMSSSVRPVPSESRVVRSSECVILPEPSLSTSLNMALPIASALCSSPSLPITAQNSTKDTWPSPEASIWAIMFASSVASSVTPSDFITSPSSFASMLPDLSESKSSNACRSSASLAASSRGGGLGGVPFLPPPPLSLATRRAWACSVESSLSSLMVRSVFISRSVALTSPACLNSSMDVVSTI